jgi:hypothetical protein
VSRREHAAAVVREVWRLTQLATQAVCAAVALVRLADLPARLPRLLAHLAKYRRKTRRTALERLPEVFALDSG